MKLIGLCLILFSAFALKANDSFVTDEPERLVKYDCTLESTLKLPTDFAGRFIIDQNELNTLKGNKVFLVELVYTAFKSSSSFDQVALNRARVREITALIPQLKVDAPTWKLVEQTGATTRDEASTYFHGFVVHYAEDLDHEKLGDFFKSYQHEPARYEVQNDVVTELNYSSGTKIHIPSFAVTYADGSEVRGSYELAYREYRNPAEIAFSGIPMVYNEKGTEYNFSSVGMYEISATQNGDPLHLQKPIVVDFKCTEQKEGVSFYKMDEAGSWSELQEVQFAGNLGGQEQRIEENRVQIGLANDEDVSITVSSIKNNGRGIDYRMEMHHTATTSRIKMNKGAWASYQKLRSENDSLFSVWVNEEISNEKTVAVKREYFSKFHAVVMQNNINAQPWNNINGAEQSTNSTLLAEGQDAGHTYPSVVKGLNSDEFGVYNCDQIYRVGNPIALTPTYLDESGREIIDKHVACLIDLNYNGAFSFHPNNLLCNAEGKNVILLFTKNKDIYLFDQTQFATLDKSSHRPSLKMVNVTDRVKSTEDLKNLLGI